MTRRPFLAALSALGLAPKLVAAQGPTPKIEKLVLADAEWQKRLSPAAYQVLRHEGTERPGSSPLNAEKRKGRFHCAGCDLPLFSSDTKFESGTGWPSFYAALPGALGTKTDMKMIVPRTEYHCARCDGHQGPRLRRRPGADGQALLQQRRRAEVRPGRGIAVRGARRTAAGKPTPLVFSRLHAWPIPLPIPPLILRLLLPLPPTPRLIPPIPGSASRRPFPPERGHGRARRALWADRGPRPDTQVFTRGDRGRDFLVVLEGTIEIYDHDDDGAIRPMRSQLPREFTGELDLFNDRAILMNGRAGPEPTRVVRIRRADFRRLVQAEPDIAEIVMRAFILRRVGLLRHGQGAVVLIGPAHSADTLRLQQFLDRNAYPLRLIDTEQDADAGGFLECFSLTPAELPVIVLPGHQALRNPSLAALADALGITEDFDHDAVFDLAVVGAGPAGLAAAVYGASEGLQTIVLESIAPGGQAGTSSKIENYLGFPTGISGQALAGRAQVQAQKFGARLAVSRAVTALDCEAAPYRLTLEDGATVRARAVVIATGARYRKLDVPGFERFEGQGIYYAATAMEADLCREAEAIVVGGGNSAGQAAVFLSRSCGHVHVLVRGEGLAATMSDYLVQRIERSDRITLHAHSEIVGLEGATTLESVRWKHRLSGAETTRPSRRSSR
jgi:thioredoxin reductase (NADPH)